jgi:thiol-disulfide isomerase/thioredoxin
MRKYRSPSFSLLLLVAGLSNDWMLPSVVTEVRSFSLTRTVAFACRNKSVPPYSFYQNHKPRSILLIASADTEETNEDIESSTAPDDAVLTENLLPGPTAMRVAELKARLKEWNVKYDDCFDKESLVVRYEEVMNDPSLRTAKTDASAERSDESTLPRDNDDAVLGTEEEEQEEKVDPTELLQELRSMSVKELRTELGERRISRAGLLEKEDLVQALLQARLRPVQFSITGLLQPGTVTDMTGEQLQQEMQQSALSVPPLLVDVYATWCGPCQILAKQLEEAAVEFGSTLRIAKLDSDRHSAVASQLRVQGLPTLILVDGATGREIDRLEGALMKEQLIQWIRSRL